MRDFIKEKKGTISLILVVLSFFFVAVFVFTKAGRTPDRVINILETDEAELVSRDTYQNFKDAADAYKLNEEEDPRTRHMRAFIEEEKKAKKDKKDVEDHGRNIADILPFDATTLAQLNLESIYTSVEDGPEREALMRIIQDVAHPLTQQQLEGLGAFFADHKKDISKIGKDDIRKVIQYITAKQGIRENQKILKQLAPSWVQLLKDTLLKDIQSLVELCKNWMPAGWNERFEDFGDWLRTCWPTRMINKIMGLMVFVLDKLWLVVGSCFSLYKLGELIKEKGFKSEIFFTDYEKFKQEFEKTPIGNSLLLSTLYIARGFIGHIVKYKEIFLWIGVAMVILIGAIAGYLWYKTESTGGIFSMYFSLPLALMVLWYAIILGVKSKETTVQKFTAPEFLTKLYYYLVNKGGVLEKIGGAVALFKIGWDIYVTGHHAFEGALFLNRLKRITKAMEVLHKAYGQNKEKNLPYFADIAAFMDDTSAILYKMNNAPVTQAPAETLTRELAIGLSYLIYGDVHYDIDKVLRDQKYKKALASFLVLYKMRDQLDSEKDYTLLEKAAENETQLTHPRIHIERLRPFVAKPKAAKSASENEAKDDKSSLAYDVNIGGHKSRAYLLVGDDESVMKDYLTCLGQNVLYTQSMGLIRGENKHYNACDMLFYADGYQDTREVHAARLANVLTYAKQHTDEKILLLVSNIAGKMSGAEHAAFVHSYAAELKKLSNVTFVFSTNNVHHMYQVIDMQKVHFTLLTPLLKDQKPTGSITIGRSQGHMQGIKMSPTVAKNFRQLLKCNPNYQGHLQDHVSKEYGSSILFLICMIFIILGLMLFRKRKK